MRIGLPRTTLLARWFPGLPRCLSTARQAVIIGRADKGIILTTGTFSVDAVSEANRTIPLVELIDGERLVTMFQSAKLGVKPRVVYEVDQSFFDQFRETTRKI